MSDGRTASSVPTRFIQIDEDGYLKMEDLRVSDAEAGKQWLASLVMDEKGRPRITIDSQQVLVESFDEPYVALDLEPLESKLWKVTMPYGHVETFQLESFRIDEWDRFHGRTERGVPFVLSRSAQARLFDLLEEFDDDSVVFNGKRYETKPWLEDNVDAVENEWWTNIYRTEEPRWDLGEPSHVLPSLVPQLKLQKMRVLVPGCGTGHDAAWFASQGHIVTAIDFSEEAIARAQATYGHLPNLTFKQADVFKLPTSMNGSFDLVFEHTLYCAIRPSRRNDLVRIWKRMLSDRGHLMGVFFAMDKPFGPPYGGTEWEVRARLDKGFRPLYWMRLRDSRERRLGTELFIYTQKIPAF